MFKQAKVDGLNHQINKFEETMESRELTEEELKRYEKLLNLRELRKQSNGKKQLDPNSILSASAGLAGILLILNYEKTDVITSKALGNVGRLFR